ncbi:effector-associated domain 2-containing protein [Spirillospora sp. CA-128828]|uniref:effector-associated domain 2-containing protein n=1 Tax=Spirillospora sp. CA-128828 TaxID=3240033 RepID=UPI003D8A3ABD
MPDAGVEGPRWHPSGHCVIVACDIAGFGDRARTDDVRRHMRDALYRRLDVSLAAGGITLAGCYWEDRGDGAMIAVPPGVPVEPLLVDVADMLRAELSRYNKTAAEIARIRLRVSVHTGEAEFDGRGLVGTAVNHAFRILEAPAFKESLRESGAWFALIVSQQVYEDVVQHAAGRIVPDDYLRIDVSVKETGGPAWVRVQGARVQGPDGGPVSAGELAATSPPAVHAGADRPTIFDLVDRMLEIPLLSSPRGRDQVVGLLRRDVAGAISRQPEARMDCVSILNTCLDYPGALKELVDVTKGLAGDALSVHRLEQAIARFL